MAKLLIWKAISGRLIVQARLSPIGVADLMLQAVIRKDGTVAPNSIRVIKGFGYGLDEACIQAINTWRFDPGSLNGTPVDFPASIEFKFRDFGVSGF
jgi:hypothetical protein